MVECFSGVQAATVPVELGKNKARNHKPLQVANLLKNGFNFFPSRRLCLTLPSILIIATKDVNFKFNNTS